MGTIMAKQRFTVSFRVPVTTAGTYVALRAPTAGERDRIQLAFVELSCEAACRFRIAYADDVEAGGQILPAGLSDDSRFRSQAEVFRTPASVTERAEESDIRYTRATADTPIPWDFEKNDIVPSAGEGVVIHMTPDSNSHAYVCIEWIEGV